MHTMDDMNNPAEVPAVEPVVETPVGVSSAVVATQTFHLPRSLFIARAAGIDAVGYRADNVHLLARNEVRESLARVKAVWDVVVHRLPEFMGDGTVAQ